MSDSRNITNAFKGIAILVVIYAYFGSNFVGDFYWRWMTEYAISFIAIFFVLSGFGIYQSLERRFAASNDHARTLYLFHYQFLFGLGYIGLIGGDDYTRSTFIALACAPGLLLICIGLDGAVCRPRGWLESWAAVRLEPEKARVAHI